MLTIEKTVLPSPEQWEIVIEGMRNPKNSWDKMDSYLEWQAADDGLEIWPVVDIGKADHQLMMNLAEGGSVHAKYRRMIPVYITLSAPLYWWKEFDTYKVGTVCNSCSTMHKIHAKGFDWSDFSHEHLMSYADCHKRKLIFEPPKELLVRTIETLNYFRDLYIRTKDKTYWWQMIQLLPTSYNQKRTVMLNYEVLAGIYRDRRNHKLDEWHTFCDWIRGLPYSELITGGDDNVKEKNESAP